MDVVVDPVVEFLSSKNQGMAKSEESSVRSVMVVLVHHEGVLVLGVKHERWKVIIPVTNRMRGRSGKFVDVVGFDS